MYLPLLLSIINEESIMKTLFKLITLSLAGLLLSTGIASASVYSHYTGENACMFTLSNLESHGFSPQNAYTSEAIHSLLNRVNVKAQNVDTLIPGQTYQLSYSCYVDHQLARITLQALPVNSPSHVITNITWGATKPA